MKNNLEDKNSHKLLSFNQFLCSAKDRPSSLVDFCERRKRMTEEEREKERNYHRAYRAKMTPEEREARLQYHRDYTHNRYVSMTPEEKKEYRDKRRKYTTKEWKEQRKIILEEKKEES